MISTLAMSQEIFNRLLVALPPLWDGKDCILYMRDQGCTNWKQMEWPGWYFQFMCETSLGQDGFFRIPGPRYGNVEFDGERVIPWDFKAHATNAGNKVPTNGYAEIRSALDEYGLVGFIVASGNAIYDDDMQTFKIWHNSLKGGISDYEIERIQRGAPSRRRKESFQLDAIKFVFIDNNTIQYCGNFQGGMRNADGTPRNQKVMIDLSDTRLEQYSFPVR